VHVAAVLRPPHPAPAAYDVDEALAVGHGAEGDLEQAREVRRAVGLGEGDGVLGREGVATGRRVVVDERAGGLAR
jgi:hypothetical protein